jgi:hypothetical protein
LSTDENAQRSLVVVQVGCNRDKAGMLIDTRTGGELFDLGEGEIWGARFTSGDGSEPSGYLVVNREGVVEIYDTGRRQRTGVIEPSEDDFTTSIAVDREGMHLATGSKHGIASVYSLPDLVSGTTAEDAIRMRRDITSGVWGIAVNGDHLATSSHGSLNVWDIASASLLAQPALEIDTPPFAAFSPDGQGLIYADGEYELKRPVPRPRRTDPAGETARDPGAH